MRFAGITDAGGLFGIAASARSRAFEYLAGDPPIPLVEIFSFQFQEYLVFRPRPMRRTIEVDGLHMSPDKATKRFKWSDVCLLTVVWIVMIAIANPIGDFPQNDDWVYAATVKSVLDSGRFEVLSMTSANFGPMAYWGALFSWVFGFSYTALRFSTLVLGVAGVVALYALVFEVWQERRVALILALTLMVNPVFFALANTFMTDVPFITLMITSMLAIAAGWRRERTELVVLGLAIAVFAVFLRQFAVIILAGFAAAYVARKGIRPKTVAVALLPLVLGLCCNYLFTLWLVDSGRKPSPPPVLALSALSPATLLWTIRSTLFAAQSYLGLFLIPLAVVCLPRGIAGRTGRTEWKPAAAVALTALIIGFVYLAKGLTVPVGENILNAYGIGPLLIGDAIKQRNLPEATTLSSIVWTCATVLTIVASAALLVALCIVVGRAVRALRENLIGPKSLGFVLGTFFAVIAVSYLAILLLIAAGFPLYDRYLLPLTILAGLAMPLLVVQDGVVARPSKRRWAVALLLVAGIGCFTIVTTHDYLRWGDTRWRALQTLTEQGISPQRIDGGYEFNGIYLYDPGYKIVRPKSWWWVVDDEYMISAGPVPGYKEIERLPVDRWWKSAGKDVFVLRRVSTPSGAPR